MEAFSLLKYWRSGGGGSGVGGGGGGAIDVSSKTTTPTTTTTIATTVREMAAVVEEEEEGNSTTTTDGDDDEGPFFDLEFSVPDEDVEENGDDDEDSGDDNREEDDDDELVGGGGRDGEEPAEFNFTVSPDSNGDGQRRTSDTNNTFSPSDDLFFKGRLVPLEEPSSSTSILLNQADHKPLPPPPQFPVSLLKTATKFRVFMLGFKKTKSETNGVGCSTSSPDPASKPETTQTQEQQQQKQSKFFEVKFKVEEVPIISLFSRDNSSKNKINKQQQQSSSSSSSSDEMNAAAAAAALEEKKFSKDVVQKYLKMIKPLYVKVSKRYGEKMGFSGQLSLSGSGKTASAAPITSKIIIDGEKSEEEKKKINQNVASSQRGGNNNLPVGGGFRVVRKHLGKSRSASSAVASVTPVTRTQAKRRDDSLLQQQDGIQSAILHCKRSFNASRDSDCCDPLSRSTSNSSSSREKSVVDASRASFDEA